MEKIISHYTILEELGRGGMGVVYKARDDRLERVVALKVLAGELADDPVSRERFLKEARLASSLQHPRICTIHEIDETPEGRLFISMDYYEGETLQQKIFKGIDLLDATLKYAIQIAEGIAVAHKKGIIHRDLKPANVIITPEDEIKILDFGLAKLSGKYNLTQTSKAMGSVSYISPEQAQGNKVDHLTDIWSLGVVLYEMVTGILPFTSDFEAAVIFAILDKSPLPPSEINDDIPEELESLIYKCLRKDRSDRIQSMEEVRNDLTRIRKGLHKKVDTTLAKDTRKSRQAERRMVTVLVTEIGSYHELMAKLDEEEADQVMTRIFETVNTVSGEFGGIITGRTDHRYTLVFGTSGYGENAPVQAINAAISLRDRMEEIRLSKNTIHIHLKTAVNTGMVIVKQIQTGAKEEYSVTGDALALAHQLSNLATGEQILAGPLTYRNTRMLFDFKTEKPFSQPGNIEPLPIYSLLSDKVRDIRKTVRLDWVIHSELVGRKKEIDTLQLHLMKLVHGEGSIINIIGEAGVGKSRLIAEFIKKEKSRDIRIIQGRAISAGETLSYHPVIDLIRNMAGIRESDDQASAFRKLEKLILENCASETDEVLPFIATLMGMDLEGTYAERVKGMEGEGLEKLIMKNMRTLLMRTASHAPLLLVVEDLHWADQSSIQLLKALYRLVEEHPILFINVFRPEYHETGEKVRVAIMERQEGYFTEILLQPLDDHQSELLIRKLLKTRTLQPQITSLVYKQTEGNPLYMEEIIRSLFDEGIITLEEGRARVSEKLSSGIIPGSINDMLMSRIDKLDEDTRMLVKVASVIGRHFFLKILLHILGAEMDVRHILDQLVRIQLIRQSHRMEEVEYLFKHALIHQAAYNTILKGQRKDLHLRVGRAIEEVFKEWIHDFYGVLAYHYGLGEDPERAEQYLIKAGERALKSAASQEALHYFREALDIYLQQKGNSADPEKMAMLNTYIGSAYFNTGHFIETARYLEKVLSHYGVKAPARSVFLIPGAMAGLLIFLIKLRFPVLLGRKRPTAGGIKINDLIQNRTNALSITESMRGVLEILYYAPRLTRYKNDHLDRLISFLLVFSFGGLSLSTSKKILDYAKTQFPSDNLPLQINLKGMICYHNLVSGNWLEEEYDDAQMEKGFRFGDLQIVITHMGMQAHIYMERGDRNAVKVLDRVLEFADIYEYDYGRLARYSHFILLHYKFQEFEKVLELAPIGLKWIRDNLGNVPGRIMVYSLQIKALFMLGKYGELEETFREAEDLSRGEQLAPYFKSYFLTATLMFEIQKLEGLTHEGKRKTWASQFRKTKKAGRRALRTCKKVAYERVETYRLIGLSYWLVKKEHTALKWWSRALSESEKLGARIERAVTMREVSRWFREAGSNHFELQKMDADSLNQQATELFEEMEIPNNNR
jgi:class 3 adenylate cyclase/tRNA A-37 threonylcarbamoyl transferase component Bud32/tetratricopeptide (TPR) repeat protein